MSGSGLAHSQLSHNAPDGTFAFGVATIALALSHFCLGLSALICRK
jgi:hypothetical protein